MKISSRNWNFWKKKLKVKPYQDSGHGARDVMHPVLMETYANITQVQCQAMVNSIPLPQIKFSPDHLCYSWLYDFILEQNGSVVISPCVKDDKNDEFDLSQFPSVRDDFNKILSSSKLF